jgi:hypothetical protein
MVIPSKGPVKLKIFLIDDGLRTELHPFLLFPPAKKARQFLPRKFQQDLELVMSHVQE